MHALHATPAITATTTRLPMTPNDTPSSGPIAASPSCTPLTADIFARMVSAPTWTNKISPPDLALARLSRLAQHHPPHRPAAVRQNDPDAFPFGFFADTRVAGKLPRRQPKAQTAGQSPLAACARR